MEKLMAFFKGLGFDVDAGEDSLIESLKAKLNPPTAETVAQVPAEICAALEVDPKEPVASIVGRMRARLDEGKEAVARVKDAEARAEASERGELLAKNADLLKGYGLKALDGKPLAECKAYIEERAKAQVAAAPPPTPVAASTLPGVTPEQMARYEAVLVSAPGAREAFARHADTDKAHIVLAFCRKNPEK